MYIDISTEEKKQEVKALFLGFTKKGDIFKYYNVSDNTANTNYIRSLLHELGIDDGYYTKKVKKKFCLYCGNELTKADSRKKFCDSSCAAKYNNAGRVLSEQTKNKIRTTMLSKYWLLNGDEKQTYEHVKHCKMCGKEFIPKKSSSMFCSCNCARKFRREVEIANKEERDIYKSQTKFRFSLNSYPNEFDFSLIKESGWYKASNHGDNLKGISRDHMFSVDEGYKQKIDPYYISHPANCKLMKHEDNFKKKTGCSITIDELKQRVNDWNKKYGMYDNKIDYTKLEKFKE